jgi:hypothetical protein
VSTTTLVNPTTVLADVDARDFRRLFVEHLGWHNADHAPVSFALDDATTYTFTQVAGYKGLRIWTCTVVPDRRTQRALDALLGQTSTERLVIFADEGRQEWRWPRKAQTGGVNAKLMVHPHTPGEHNQSLVTRLTAIAIDFDEDVSLVDLLARMRDAFNAESETAAVQAARLMKALYGELATAGVPDHDATLLLARLLFLLFADDSDMWITSPDLFENFLREHTTSATLHTDLSALFHILNTAPKGRDLPAGSPLRVFRYVNGGLFADDDLALPPLTAAFRSALLDACDFDWAKISPAVFGSMFQTVKDKTARREGGEHYTTEANILKTIGPLFLDELHERLDAAWDDKGQLTRLHTDLGRLRVMDPACGCGNFLIVAYRELRSLELEVLKRRRNLDDISGIRTGGVNLAQGTLDPTEDRLKVRLDHFYGIDIDPWPVRIAQTALLLMDHLANQALSEEFGGAPDRLPIRIAPAIHERNALHVDWATIVPPSSDVIVVGNPPFVGRKYRTKAQIADMQLVWGKRYNVNLDFVTTWYAKAVEYFGPHRGRWAFVSTNSVSQGEPVARLWQTILDVGWRCRFAHRSFAWTTEALDGAAVHVSILGFDRERTPQPLLVTYPDGPARPGTGSAVTNINPYLAEGPNVLIQRRSTPLNPQMPPAVLGSMPNDGGHLVVEASEHAEVAADPVAAKYLRRLVGAQELLYDEERWCLWLTDMNPGDKARSPVLSARIEGCRQVRLASRNPGTVDAAVTPHLFWHIAQPTHNYLCIPSTVSETRSYWTPAYFHPDVISSNLNYVAADPDGFALAVLSSSMFMTWMQTVAGRLESRLRFSGSFTYNAFPLPKVTAANRAELVEAAAEILAGRAAHPGRSLAQLYAPGKVPADLQGAHDRVDHVMDRIFRLGDTGTREEDRRRALFASYATLTSK